MVCVIDMHNHLVAPEVVVFLGQEGAHYNTRIVERDGQRVFVIHDTARRPLHAKISQVEARLSDMDAEGIDIQAISCVPFVLIGRLAMGYRHFPECQAAIPDPPSTYINQFAFDIIAFRQDMLRYLVNTYGVERLVVGSDYPLPAGLAHPVAEVKALGLDPETESAVLGGNASRLLHLAP